MDVDSWFQAQRDPYLDTRWAEDEPPPQFQSRVVAAAWQRAERGLVSWVRRNGPKQNVADRSVAPGLADTFSAYLQIFHCLDSHWQSSPSGFIYVMEAAHEPAPGEERVKIGFSSDPNVRLKQVQTGCPFKLCLGATLPGVPAQEQGLHQLCAAQREHGEWFRYDGVVRYLTQALHALGLVWANEVTWR